MSPKRRDISARTAQQNGFKLQIHNIFRAELGSKYDGPQLERIRSSGFDIYIEEIEDTETQALFDDGTLILPENHPIQELPDQVWHYKACFRADPSMNVELIIGDFRGHNLVPIGVREGTTWVYTPKAHTLPSAS